MTEFMNLSEAMKLGASLRPQGIGAALHEGKTCALGAAADAISALAGIHHCLDVAPFSIPWAWIYEMRDRVCPACCRTMPNGVNLIVHLNDSHKWTREAIADHIATIEPQPELVADRSAAPHLETV